jgi:hypothetical protein
VLRSPLPQSLRLSTGIAGLDNIMGGGLMPGRLYLVEGTPGAGKTTLGLRMVSPSSTSQGCNSVTSRLGLDRFSADVSSKSLCRLIRRNHLPSSSNCEPPSSNSSRLPTTAVSRLLKSCAIPPVKPSGIASHALIARFKIASSSWLHRQSRDGRRGPVAGVTRKVAMAETQLRVASDERALRLAGAAFQAAMRGTKLTTQLLAFSHLPTEAERLLGQQPHFRNAVAVPARGPGAG